MDEFGPIIAPDNIAYSYDTLGWKLMALFIASILLMSLTIWVYKYSKNAHRRKAVKALLSMEEISQINVVLKSVALHSFERKEIASLYDESWVNFLCSKLKKSNVAEEKLLSSIHAAYAKKASKEQIQYFKSFAIAWVRGYHV